MSEKSSIIHLMSFSKEGFFCYNGVNVRGRYERNEKEKI